MKFITEEIKEEKPTFGQVEIDQFFIHSTRLYQKLNNERANQLTGVDGKPFSASFIYFNKEERIGEICPRVIKIEF